MNVQIYEEASDWIVKHRNGGLDSQERRAFDTWLRTSPQHMRAYLEMSSVWEDLPSIDGGLNPSAEELIARARADDNVVSLADAPFLSTERLPRTSATTIGQVSARRGHRDAARDAPKRGWLPTLAAAILITFLSTGWFYLQRGVYSTEIGEQRSLTLADGSRVELNARSRMKVRYTDDERRIELLEGQALFHVAKNSQRPFIVRTGDTHVRAVGTSFDVYRGKSGTVVTVVEGRVAVTSISSPEKSLPNLPLPSPSQGEAGSKNRIRIQYQAAPTLLSAGQQLVVTPVAVSSPKPANVAAATAWTRGSLVFDAAPLTEVVDEFNRYNMRRLIIQDPQLEDFHVSGVFSSVEPTLLLRFLRAQPELIIEETETEIHIKKK